MKTTGLEKPTKYPYVRKCSPGRRPRQSFTTAHKLGPGRTHAGWTASQDGPHSVAAQHHMSRAKQHWMECPRMLKLPKAADSMLTMAVYEPSSFKLTMPTNPQNAPDNDHHLLGRCPISPNWLISNHPALEHTAGAGTRNLWFSSRGKHYHGSHTIAWLMSSTTSTMSGPYVL